MKKTFEYLSMVLIIFVIFACTTVKEKTNKKGYPASKEIELEKVFKFEGLIKFYKNSNKFLTYNKGNLKIYKNLNLLYKSKIEKAGRFSWNPTGDKIYFISYNSFIKKNHWLNSGKIKYIDLSTKKIFTITERNNFSYFHIIGEKSFIAIRLGSIWIYNKNGQTYNYKKILNGNCLKAYAFTDLIAVYRRLKKDLIQFIDYEGNTIKEFKIEKINSTSLPNYTFMKKNNTVILYQEDKIRSFTIYGSDIVEKKLKLHNSDPINKNIKVGSNNLYWKGENKNIYFYNEFKNKDRFLYKLEDVHPLKFFKNGSVIYFKWIKGMLAFKVKV